MIELIQKIFLAMFGVVPVALMCGFIYKRDSHLWEELAQPYGRKWMTTNATIRHRHMIFYKDGFPARSYAGLLSIGVYPDGIGLKINPWLRPFCRPVFIPFSDIQGWDQKWYWNAPSTELMFRKAPDLQIIMPTSQIKWIASHKEGKMSLSDERSPRENWPWATYAYAIAAVFMLLTVLVISAYKYLNL